MRVVGFDQQFPQWEMEQIVVSFGAEVRPEKCGDGASDKKCTVLKEEVQWYFVFGDMTGRMRHQFLSGGMSKPTGHQTYCRVLPANHGHEAVAIGAGWTSSTVHVSRWARVIRLVDRAGIRSSERSIFNGGMRQIRVSQGAITSVIPSLQTHVLTVRLTFEYPSSGILKLFR